MDIQPASGLSEEIRCPSCSRLLVLRSGPQVAPHFAHRPRQSCRRRSPGRAPATRLRLEQLMLFDVAPYTPPEPVPVLYYRPIPAPVVAASPGPGRSAIRRRPRRRAWLPRLIRWVRARSSSG